MTNPNRGRGGAHVNGHTSQPNGAARRPAPGTSTDDQDSDTPRGWGSGYHHQDRRPPVPPRGGFRGRAFPNHGGFRGAYRGRGYSAAPALSS